MDEVVEPQLCDYCDQPVDPEFAAADGDLIFCDEGCRGEHRADRQHTLIDLCDRTRYISDEDYPD